MADINIYGRLWNQTTDGEIASAAQVKDSSFSKASEVDASGSNPSQHDINEYLLDAIGTGGTASADALAQKVDKTTTINGKALDGNITLSASDLGIDTTLFTVVDTLPTSDIDTTKIYVVTSETTGTNNAYTEYIYVNSAWEKVGEYQASVDLNGYVKAENTDVGSGTILKNTASGFDVDTLLITGNSITVANGSYEKSKLTGQSLVISDTEVGQLTLTDNEISLSYSDTNESTVINPNSITLSDDDGTKTLTVTEIAKLEGIEEGAQVNQNAFSVVTATDADGNSLGTATAEGVTDSLIVMEGDNISLSCEGSELHISCTATADEALTEEEIDAACA